jgi:hypothetical protein
MHWNTPVAEMETALLSMWTHLTWGDLAGYLGGVLILLSFFRTTMIPLRAMGAMNVCAGAFGTARPRMPSAASMGSARSCMFTRKNAAIT